MVIQNTIQKHYPAQPNKVPQQFQKHPRYSLCIYDTDVQFSWVKCCWDWGCSIFHIGIYTAITLPKCLWVSDCDLFQTVDPADILNLGDLCMLWSNSVTG